MADLGEGSGRPSPPLFWVKKKKFMTEERKANRASKSKLTTPAPGLDLPQKGTVLR